MTPVRALLAAAAAVAALTTIAARAQTNEPVDNPGRLLASNCFQCHGTDGHGVRGGVEGIEADEVIEELREMAQVTNPRGEEGLMMIHARAYSAAQVRMIADYLASVCRPGSEGCTVTAPPPPTTYRASVQVSRTRLGDVVSDVDALSCLRACRETTAVLAGGSRVTLTAVPRSGARFRGWEGDCSGRARTCTLDMTRAREATARFSR